jgi:hypothetical protein
MKLKQVSKTNESECDVKGNHSMIDYCGKLSHDRNEVKYFSLSQNRKRGTVHEGNKNQNYCQWFETLNGCVASL